MVEHGAHLGIALDGDADRVIMADEHGEIIDGDQILALIARSWQRGRHDCAAAASSPRSCPTWGWNGILAGRGLQLHRTKVGDRYVAEHMRAAGSMSAASNPAT